MQVLPKISAIIVALNEEELIRQIINELRQQDYEGELEIILADGGSEDKTLALAQIEGIKVLLSPTKGRAWQMNAAAEIASGDILFFVHADMRFGGNTLSALARSIAKGYAGGGFSNEFETHNARIKQLGHYLNFRFVDKREQSDKGIFYGDNGIFVLTHAFKKLEGFREILIMEDYDFSRRLRNEFRTIKIKSPRIIVSSRRHLKAGFLRTRIQWILIRILFKWGISPHFLSKCYKNIR